MTTLPSLFQQGHQEHHDALICPPLLHPSQQHPAFMSSFSSSLGQLVMEGLETLSLSSFLYRWHRTTKKQKHFSVLRFLFIVFVAAFFQYMAILPFSPSFLLFGRLKDDCLCQTERGIEGEEGKGKDKKNKTYPKCSTDIVQKMRNGDSCRTLGL